MQRTSMIAVVSATVAITLTGASGAMAQRKIDTIVLYKFNTGPADAAVTTAVDSGPNHLNAAVTGPLTYSKEVPPSNGGRFSLNATGDYDYASVADTPLLDLTGNFTLSLSAMPTGGQNGQDSGDYIVIKDLAQGDGTCLDSYGIGYNASTGKFSGNISGSSNTNVPCYSVSSTDTFPVGTWHSVSMKYTYSAGRQRAVLSLSVDGVDEGRTVINDYPGIAYGNSPFLIGAANFGSGDHDFYRRNFVGYIDNVKITVP